MLGACGAGCCKSTVRKRPARMGLLSKMSRNSSVVAISKMAAALEGPIISMRLQACLPASERACVQGCKGAMQ